MIPRYPSGRTPTRFSRLSRTDSKDNRNKSSLSSAKSSKTVIDNSSTSSNRRGLLFGSSQSPLEKSSLLPVPKQSPKVDLVKKHSMNLKKCVEVDKDFYCQLLKFDPLQYFIHHICLRVVSPSTGMIIRSTFYPPPPLIIVTPYMAYKAFEKGETDLARLLIKACLFRTNINSILFTRKLVSKKAQPLTPRKSKLNQVNSNAPDAQIVHEFPTYFYITSWVNKPAVWKMWVMFEYRKAIEDSVPIVGTSTIADFTKCLSVLSACSKMSKIDVYENVFEFAMNILSEYEKVTFPRNGINKSKHSKSEQLDELSLLMETSFTIEDTDIKPKYESNISNFKTVSTPFGKYKEYDILLPEYSSDSSIMIKDEILSRENSLSLHPYSEKSEDIVFDFENLGSTSSTPEPPKLSQVELPKTPPIPILSSEKTEKSRDFINKRMKPRITKELLLAALSPSLTKSMKIENETIFKIENDENENVKDAVHNLTNAMLGISSRNVRNSIPVTPIKQEFTLKTPKKLSLFNPDVTEICDQVINSAKKEPYVKDEILVGSISGTPIKKTNLSSTPLRIPKSGPNSAKRVSVLHSASRVRASKLEFSMSNTSYNDSNKAISPSLSSYSPATRRMKMESRPGDESDCSRTSSTRKYPKSRDILSSINSSAVIDYNNNVFLDEVSPSNTRKNDSSSYLEEEDDEEVFFNLPGKDTPRVSKILRDPGNFREERLVSTMVNLLSTYSEKSRIKTERDVTYNYEFNSSPIKSNQENALSTFSAPNSVHKLMNISDEHSSMDEDGGSITVLEEVEIGSGRNGAHLRKVLTPVRRSRRLFEKTPDNLGISSVSNILESSGYNSATSPPLKLMSNESSLN